MCYIQGEGRHQGTLFPVLLDDLVQGNHISQVIHAFVNGLKWRYLDSSEQRPQTQAGPVMIRATYEVVSVRLSEPDPFVATLGSRVPSKCRAYVASWTLVSRPQKHRRVPPGNTAKQSWRLARSYSALQGAAV
jgi:hypothetical protein